MSFLLMKKCIIKYGSRKKTMILPKDYNDFLREINLCFNINKNFNNNIILFPNNSPKIENSEDYSIFIKKIQINQKIEITISINNNNDELILNKNDSYDKDENFIFKNINKSISEKSLDLEQILNESFDLDNNDLFKSEISKNIIRFSSYCNICDKFPIPNIMFYCSDCDLNLCEDCEKNFGYNHRHCYYKITNQEQYEEILKIKLQKLKNNRNLNTDIKEQKNNKNNGIFHSIVGFIMKK